MHYFFRNPLLYFRAWFRQTEYKVMMTKEITKSYNELGQQIIGPIYLS